jgi:hypothetical protein
LRRSIELDDNRLKERIIALTVSQLVTTEAVPPKKPKKTYMPAPPLSSPLPSPTPASPASASSTKEKETVDHVSISIGGGVKPHDVFSLVTGYWLLRGDVRFTEKLGFVSVLSFEVGHVERKNGGVTVMSGLAGIGGVWEIAAFRHLHMEFMALASMGYTHLSGESSTDEIGSGDIGGVAGEFVLGPSFVFVAKKLLLALDILGGYTVKNPIGYVHTEDSVTPGGAWIGGGLRIGLKKL